VVKNDVHGCSAGHYPLFCWPLPAVLLATTRCSAGHYPLFCWPLPAVLLKKKSRLTSIEFYPFVYRYKFRFRVKECGQPCIINCYIPETTVQSIWYVHAVRCTEWPYDISILFSAQNGLMTFPCCSLQRMALWHFHALQCTEWPYDISLLFSAQNALMAFPCCSVHRMTLWHFLAVQYTEWQIHHFRSPCICCVRKGT
jgi:hypothetical protein